jgi:hypothetical protein
VTTVSWLDEQLLGYQEGLCSINLVIDYCKLCIPFSCNLDLYKQAIQ